MPRYSQQSPYPTGRAPLAFDLSEQMWNIAQQRIQNRKQEIEEQKKQISENEAILLTALDFETVKGAQDKFAQDMATRIDQMTNKWSERMKAKGGILDTNDKLELLRDKRDIENRIQVGAADVAQFQQLQNDLADPKKRTVYNVPETSSKMAKYALEGKIGTGSAINLPTYQPQAWGQEAMAFAESNAPKELLDPRAWDDVAMGIDEYGNTKFQKSNKKIVEGHIEWLKTTPEWQSLYEEQPYNAELLLESFRKKYLREPVRAIPKSQSATTGGKTATQIKAEKEQQDKFSGFNNIALNLMDRDEATIKSLKSTGFGKIGDIRYTEEPDGTYMHVHFQPTSAADTRGSEMIKLPKDQSDVAGQKYFYNKLWDILPSEFKEGVDVADLPKVMKPRAGQYQGKQVPFYAEKSVEKTLDQAIKNPKKSFFQAAADTIKKYIPGLKIKATSEGFEVDGKTYNIKNPPKGTTNTPEALKAKVMENVKPQKKLDPNAPEAESSAPATQPFDVGGEKYYIPTDMVEEFLKDNPTAKRVE